MEHKAEQERRKRKMSVNGLPVVLLKRAFYGCCGIFFVWFILSSRVQASQAAQVSQAEQVSQAAQASQTTQETEEIVTEWNQQLLEELDFESIQRELEEVMDAELNFEDTVVQAAEGESLFSLEKIGSTILEQLKSAWGKQKGTFFSILTLTVCAAFLANFSHIFKSQQIAEVSFEITYMLLFLILLRSFEQASDVTGEVLTGMQDFMRALIPAYFLSVTMASSAVTASVFYPFVLGLIDVVRMLMESLLLPVLDGYVILVFVNHLTKEEYLSQLSDALTKGISWVLKTMLAVVAGFHMIQGIITPAVDSLKSTTLSRAASALPGVGNLAGSVTDVLLGSGILIKNGIGVAGLMVLVFICLVPLLQLGCWVLLLEVIGAMIQPVSDKRMTGCIAGMSQAGKLLFRMVFTVAALFMLSIALVAVSTGIRV